MDAVLLYREASNFLEQMKTFRAALDKTQGDSLMKKNDLAYHDAIKKMFGAAM